MDYAWDPTCLINAQKIPNFPKIARGVKIRRYALVKLKELIFG